MNLENRIKKYLNNSIEFVEWKKDGLTLNDVAWLMEDFIKHDRLVSKNNKPFAIPDVSNSVCPECGVKYRIHGEYCRNENCSSFGY